MIKIVLSSFAVLVLFCANHIMAEEKYQQSYPEFGITKSLLIQPSIGYWWDRAGLRFSGIYLNEEQNEFHLNIGYKLVDSEKVQHCINLLTSWVAGSDLGADYKYGATGITYSLNYRGLFLEIGLALPWRDFLGNLENDLVVPCGYWGYIYRFRTK